MKKSQAEDCDFKRDFYLVVQIGHRKIRKNDSKIDFLVSCRRNSQIQQISGQMYNLWFQIILVWILTITINNFVIETQPQALRSIWNLVTKMNFVNVHRFLGIFGLVLICIFGLGFSIWPKARCFFGQIFGFGLKWKTFLWSVSKTSVELQEN